MVTSEYERAVDFLVGKLGLNFAQEMVEGSYGTMTMSEMALSSVRAKQLGMLPCPIFQRQLTWAGLSSMVPRWKGDVTKHNKNKIQELLSIGSRKEFEAMADELYPWRTKTDRALRRTRLRDWILTFKRNGRWEECVDLFLETKVGWDQIFVQNLLVARFLMGTDWWLKWKGVGALEGDIEHWMEVCSFVSNKIKTVGLEDELWQHFVENGNLVGYRNLPYAGFDLERDAEELANGGLDHDYFGRTWDDLVSEFLPMKPERVTYVPFDEWVKDASWVTAGASSVGRVYLDVPDEDGMTRVKFKARKNMVPDVYDLGQLAFEAKQLSLQTNTTVVKPELGKVRLAVAGDMYTYLKMAWIGRLMGKADRAWPGSTSEEDMVTQTERMYKMIQLCARGYGMPYDYKGFDRQPTTEELKGIGRAFIRAARTNVPQAAMAEFDLIANQVIDGFDWSTLVTRIPGEDRPWEQRVTGGLMSGLAWTSKIGNGWNSVMTGLAMWMLKAWGVSVDQIERYIRGDDSAIFTETWQTATLMDLSYKAIGAVAGEGKFSVQFGATEFLRTWYTDRCSGYPGRTIPGLTQRKPWSNNPWSPAMVLEALWANTRTLVRRLGPRAEWANKAWKSCKWLWCRLHGLPLDVTKVPRASGGLGIEAPELGRVYTMKNKLPKQEELKGAVVVNLNDWRTNRKREYFLRRYNIEVDYDRLREMSNREVLQTIGSDNVPEYSSRMRKAWLRKIKTNRYPVQVTHIKGWRVPLYFQDPIKQMAPDQYGDYMSKLRNDAPWFGVCPEIAIARRDFDELELKMTFTRFLELYFPRVIRMRRKFARGWHLTEILDYLEGKIRVVAETLHPSLIKMLVWLTARANPPHLPSVNMATMWTARLYEPSVASCLISKMLYWW